MAILQLKRSNIPEHDPTTLAEGELAANVADGILYLGLADGSVVKFFSSVAGEDVTIEALTYYFLVNDLPFTSIYFDCFNEDTLTKDGSPVPEYHQNGTNYHCFNGSILLTDDIIDSEDTLYRFLLHYETTEVNDTTPDITIEYSIDQGNTWNTLDNSKLDDIVLISDGFNTLRFRFTFNNECYFNSFGVCYNYDFNQYTSDTRMFEILTVDQDYTAPKEITIPNGSTYTTNNKSLEIYLNRARLIPTVDYEEVDSRTVRFLVDLKQNDTIVFTEKYGYVDTSIDNKSRLDYEHNNQGQHIFTDLTTGTKYRLAVDNGNIILIEQ